MTRRTPWLPALALLAVLAAPPPASADTLDDILKLLATAGIVDRAIVDAKPLIECLVKNGSAAACIDVQKTASAKAGELADETTSAAEKAAAQFVPTDPAVKTVVEIVKAANASNWLKVLELTGIKLLGEIACKAGLTWSGPAKEFICGQWAPEIMSLAEPVVREVLSIVQSWPNIDLWKLVSVMSFDFACKVSPDVPLKNEVCSLLGAAVKAIASLGKAALDGLAAGAEALADLLGGGGSAKVSIEIYYSHGIRPLIYKRSLERLMIGRQDLGLDKAELDQCMAYYGPIQAAGCAALSPRLRNESEAMVKLAQAMPQGYFERWLVEEVAEYALTRPGVSPAYKNYIDKLAPKEWDTLVEHTKASAIEAYLGVGDADLAYFDALFAQCRARVDEALMGIQGYGTPLFPGLAPQRLTVWVCYHAVGRRFADALLAESSRLNDKVSPALTAAGCTRTSGFPLSFTCADHVGFGACLGQSFQDYGKNRYCKLDTEVAAKSLAQSLIAVLGDRRCQYIPLTKGNSGDWDPRVHCTRPWKQRTCNVLLRNFLAKHGALSSRIEMRCSYHPDAAFTANTAKAKELVAALNSGPARGVDCSIGWDPVTFGCKDLKSPPALPPQHADIQVKPCPEDPEKHGADQVCYSVPWTIKDSNAELAGQPMTQAPLAGAVTDCQLELTYLEPQPPVIEASVPSLATGDQFRIRCEFRRRTRQFSWQNCDEATRKLAVEMQPRVRVVEGPVSGIIMIDDARTSVGTSPPSGSDFSREQLWSHSQPGNYTASCQVDNPLAHELPDAPSHLAATVSYEVSARRAGDSYSSFDPAQARHLATRTAASEPVPAPGMVARQGAPAAVPATERGGTPGRTQPPVGGPVATNPIVDALQKRGCSQQEDRPGYYLCSNQDAHASCERLRVEGRVRECRYIDPRRQPNRREEQR